MKEREEKKKRKKKNLNYKSSLSLVVWVGGLESGSLISLGSTESSSTGFGLVESYLSINAGSDGKLLNHVTISECIKRP